MLRFPNLVSQAGLYRVGTPNYIDVSTGDATDGPFVTFPTKATAESWVDGDVIGVLALKANNDFKVWQATWDATNEYLEVSTEEETFGTWSDLDAVTVSAVMTDGMLAALVAAPPEGTFKTVATTTYTLLPEDAGKTLRFTNDAGCNVTCADTLPVGFHCLVVQVGAVTVNVDTENTDTMRTVAAGTGVDTSAAYDVLYVRQFAEGEWEA